MKTQKDEIKKIAFLVSAAAILQVVESFFPQVMPGVKLGLANMIVLIALVKLGFRAAIEIAIMRTLISSLILGTFLSPSFILSFSSAITSTLAMAVALKFLSGGKKVFLSLIGVSIIGAITHNLTQITLVYLMLIKTTGIFMLLPWLGISSVITGWLTGVVASQVCRRLDKKGAAGMAFLKTGNISKAAGKFSMGRYIEGNSAVHFAPAELKIAAVFAAAAALVLSSDWRVYSAVLIIILTAAFASKIPLMRFFDGVKRMYFFIAFSFAMPFLFTTGGTLIFSAGFLNVTREGLYAGAGFAARLILLMTSAAVLMRTTKPEELAAGIRSILKPFGFMGISGERVSGIVASSLGAIPVFWDNAQEYLKKYRLAGKKAKGLVLALSSLIAVLYLAADKDIV